MLSQLSSKKFAFSLLIPLLFFLVLSTFYPSSGNLIIIIRILLAALGVNLLLCTCRNWRHLSDAVIMLHLGSLLILGGGLLGAAGYIATINIYEGEGSATAYRWDLQRDEALGFRIVVKEIHQDFYPAAVQIGILKNGKKVDLRQTHTGATYTFGQYKIFVKELDVDNKNLHLLITTGGEEWDYNTALDNQFPLTFKLIAYKKPITRKAWVDLEIYQNGKIAAQGQAAVNHPLKWHGMKFYHTQTSHNKTDRRYAGIQIVNDPGIPIVYSGFFIMFIGGLLLLRPGVFGRLIARLPH